MKCRRVLSLVLAFVMLMSYCFTGTTAHVHAVGTEPTIVVSEVKAEAGKTAAVSISLENNPGIVNMILTVSYDTDTLTLVEVLDAGILGGTVHKPELQSPYTLCWENDTATTNFTVTGTIVTLFFDVASTAQGDVAAVEVSYDYDRNEIVDKDMNKVRFAVDNGSVTVGQPDANLVSGFTIKGYLGSAAQAYAQTDDEITFVALEKSCDHTGGEATCKDKAVCTTCGQPYGDLNANNHKNTEIRDAATASCNTPGYTGDTWCKDCETKTATGTRIPATEDREDADGDWEVNQTYHFHTCGCGTEFDSASHTGGTATCKEKAVCTVCGTAYGDFNSSNHTGGTYLTGQKEASCYEEGYTGDTYCTGCNVKIATGTAIEKDSHNPASVWSTDETHHWKECTKE